MLLATDLTDANEAVTRAADDLATALDAPLVVIPTVTDKTIEDGLSELPEDQAFVDYLFDQLRQEATEHLLLDSPCPVVAVPV